MVTVTDRATEELRNILANAAPQPGQALRLVPSREGGLGLGLDEEREGDEIVKSGDEKILLVSSGIAEALDEATIDVQDSEEGPKLVISR